MALIRGHEQVRAALDIVIRKSKLPSALLFRGPEAVGKKLVALSVARDLLCEKGPPACGTCGSCLRVSKGQHEGLLLVSTEEVSLKLDDIQSIFDFVRLKLLSRARIVIINDAHKLNIQAANRILKTLEEPPPNTHFILVTSQEAALPLTIRSRCQLMRFGPLDESHLKEMLEAPTWAYKACQGRMDLLQRLSKDSGDERKLAFSVFKGLLSGERSYVFPQFSEFSKEKDRTLEMFNFFEQFLRDLWIKDSENLIHPDLEKEYQKLSESPQIEQRIETIWMEFKDTRAALEMNADRNLNLENLWFRLQEVSL